MEKLRTIIEKHNRWGTLTEFVDRIEAQTDIDFSLSVENAKALLESISKEICKSYGLELNGQESFNAVVKKAYQALGYQNDDLVNQISRSLSSIAQKLGDLRNEIGITSHGRTLDEIRERNGRVNEFTKEFLIDSTVVVACFLIQSFEDSYRSTPSSVLKYEECSDFNIWWDGVFEEYSMGDYSFSPSQILFGLNNDGYRFEYENFILDSGENFSEPL